MKCSPVMLITTICIGLMTSIVMFSINPSSIWVGVSVIGTFVAIGICVTNIKPDEDNVTNILLTSQGGVYKRIDENRELMELLREKAPSLLKENFWIEDWLKSNDVFLNDLVPIAPADDKRIKDGLYPRVWPTNTENNSNNRIV